MRAWMGHFCAGTLSNVVSPVLHICVGALCVLCVCFVCVCVCVLVYLYGCMCASA